MFMNIKKKIKNVLRFLSYKNYLKKTRSIDYNIRIIIRIQNFRQTI